MSISIKNNNQKSILIGAIIVFVLFNFYSFPVRSNPEDTLLNGGFKRNIQIFPGQIPLGQIAVYYEQRLKNSKLSIGGYAGYIYKEIGLFDLPPPSKGFVTGITLKNNLKPLLKTNFYYGGLLFYKYVDYKHDYIWYDYTWYNFYKGLLIGMNCEECRTYEKRIKHVFTFDFIAGYNIVFLKKMLLNIYVGLGARYHYVIVDIEQLWNYVTWDYYEYEPPMRKSLGIMLPNIHFGLNLGYVF